MRNHTLLAATLALAACGDDGGSTFGGGGNSGNVDYGGSGDGGGGGDGGDTGSTGDGGGSDGGGDGGDTGGDTGVVIVGTGYDAGDTAYDLVGTGTSGGFSLHALYGTPVLLMVGHLDDAGMQSMVSWMGQVAEVTSVAVIGRDSAGVAADAADASALAATYSIDHVVIDPTGELVSTWAERNPPKTYVIDAEMQIYWTAFGTVGQVQVEDKVDEMND